MKENESISWHPSFAAALQLELREYEHDLKYMLEYPLTTEPLKVDVLILKSTAQPIDKNIARLFRTYNVIEYKSPKDYASVDDLYKAMAYVYLYKAVSGEQEGAGTVDVEHMTLTIVCLNQPSKLLEHVRTRGMAAIPDQPGIYRIEGMGVPVQLIVQSELPKEENEYLTLLTDQLHEKQPLHNVLVRYLQDHKNELYRLMLYAISAANPTVFMEVLSMPKIHLDEKGEQLFNELVYRWKLDEKWEQKGIEKGKQEAILELLAEHGPIPAAVRETIEGETDVNRLRRWLKLAAKVPSMDEFVKHM